MTIFSTNNKLYLACLMVLTSQAHAMVPMAHPMTYPACAMPPIALPAQAIQQPPFINLFDGLIHNNQTLSKQCYLQLQEIANQERLIHFESLDSLVAQAKNLPKPCGGDSPLAITLLEKARAEGHPEARYLRGETEANILFQMYRLEKGKREFLVLQSIQPHDPKTKNLLPLIGETVAYTLFRAITNHPKNKECDDISIRAEAEYALGYMCHYALGVPEEEANLEKALQHIEKAREYGHPSAQDTLDKLYTIVASQKTAENQSQSVAPTMQEPIKQEPVKRAEQTHELLQQGSPTQVECKVAVSPLSNPLLRMIKNPGTPSADVKTQQQTPVTAQAATVSVPVAIAQSPVLENIPQSKPVQVKQDQPEKVQQKSEQKKVKKSKKPTQALDRVEKPTEAVFTISEDISLQVQECQPEADSAPSKSKKTSSKAQQKKQVKPSKKPSKAAKSTAKVAEPVAPPATKQEKQAKESKVKASAQAETMADQVSKIPQKIADKKEEKKEKKQKDKVKSKQQSKAPSVATLEKEKAEAAKAYELVTNLISYYLDETAAADARAALCEPSFTWKSTKATYQGTHNILAGKKFKRDSISYAELMGIMRYLSGNGSEEQAKQIIAEFKESENPITNWWKAHMLMTCKSETTEEKNKVILDALQIAFSKRIDFYQRYKNLFVRDDGLINFARTRAGIDAAASVIFVKMGFAFGYTEIALDAESARNFLEFAWANNASIDALFCLGLMYVCGICLEQSLSEAVNILQSLIESHNDNHKVNIDLINCLSLNILNYSMRKNDFVSQLHNYYLQNIVREIKFGIWDHQRICKSLNDAEKILTTEIPPEKQDYAAQLFVISDAYQALLPIAETNYEIASLVGAIATKRRFGYRHNASAYEKISEIETNFQKKKEEYYKAVDLIKNIIPHYIDQTNCNALIAQLNTLNVMYDQSHDWPEPHMVYKSSYELLQTQNLEKNQAYSELIAILHFLQGNLADAKQIETYKDSNKIVTQWYRALILVATEPNSPERNNLILQIANNLFEHQFTALKKVQLFSVTEDKCLESILSTEDHGIPDNIRLVFQKALCTIELANEKDSLEFLNTSNVGLVCQANRLIWRRTLQSFTEALSILQKVILSQDPVNAYVCRLLKDICEIADTNRDNILSLHSTYLYIIQMAKMKRDMQIRNALAVTENKLDSIVDRAEAKIAASLLLETWAFDALVLRAKDNEQINITLHEIVSKRTAIYGHPLEWYKALIGDGKTTQ